MDNVTLEEVRKLRKITGYGLLDCKRALLNSASFEDAIVYLRKTGALLVQKYYDGKYCK